MASGAGKAGTGPWLSSRAGEGWGCGPLRGGFVLTTNRECVEGMLLPNYSNTIKQSTRTRALSSAILTWEGGLYSGVREGAGSSQ